MSSSASPYECEMVGEYAVITLSESLNSVQWKAIDDIGGELVERLEALRKPACVVDLSKLNYMGSAMVALVVRMWKSLDARGGRLVVVNRDANVLEVLNLAGLTKVWTMTDSRDEALRLIGAGRGGHSSHGTGGDDSSAAIPAVIGLLLVLVACGALGMVLAGVMPEQRGPVVGVLSGWGHFWDCSRRPVLLAGRRPLASSPRSPAWFWSGTAWRACPRELLPDRRAHLRKTTPNQLRPPGTRSPPRPTKKRATRHRPTRPQMPPTKLVPLTKLIQPMAMRSRQRRRATSRKQQMKHRPARQRQTIRLHSATGPKCHGAVSRQFRKTGNATGQEHIQ